MVDQDNTIFFSDKIVAILVFTEDGEDHHGGSPDRLVKVSVRDRISSFLTFCADEDENNDEIYILDLLASVVRLTEERDQSRKLWSACYRYKRLGIQVDFEIVPSSDEAIAMVQAFDFVLGQYSFRNYLAADSDIGNTIGSDVTLHQRPPPNVVAQGLEGTGIAMRWALRSGGQYTGEAIRYLGRQYTTLSVPAPTHTTSIEGGEEEEAGSSTTPSVCSDDNASTGVIAGHTDPPSVPDSHTNGSNTLNVNANRESSGSCDRSRNFMQPRTVDPDAVERAEQRQRWAEGVHSGARIVTGAALYPVRWTGRKASEWGGRGGSDRPSTEVGSLLSRSVFDTVNGLGIGLANVCKGLSEALNEVGSAVGDCAMHQSTSRNGEEYARQVTQHYVDAASELGLAGYKVANVVTFGWQGIMLDAMIEGTVLAVALYDYLLGPVLLQGYVDMVQLPQTDRRRFFAVLRPWSLSFYLSPADVSGKPYKIIAASMLDAIPMLRIRNQTLQAAAATAAATTPATSPATDHPSLQSRPALAATTPATSPATDHPSLQSRPALAATNPESTPSRSSAACPHTSAALAKGPGQKLVTDSDPVNHVHTKHPISIVQSDAHVPTAVEPSTPGDSDGRSDATEHIHDMLSAPALSMSWMNVQRSEPPHVLKPSGDSPAADVGKSSSELNLEPTSQLRGGPAHFPLHAVLDFSNLSLDDVNYDILTDSDGDYWHRSDYDAFNNQQCSRADSSDSKAKTKGGDKSKVKRNDKGNDTGAKRSSDKHGSQGTDGTVEIRSARRCSNSATSGAESDEDSIGGVEGTSDGNSGCCGRVPYSRSQKKLLSVLSKWNGGVTDHIELCTIDCSSYLIFPLAFDFQGDGTNCNRLHAPHGNDCIPAAGCSESSASGDGLFGAAPDSSSSTSRTCSKAAAGRSAPHHTTANTQSDAQTEARPADLATLLLWFRELRDASQRVEMISSRMAVAHAMALHRRLEMQPRTHLLRITVKRFVRTLPSRHALLGAMQFTDSSTSRGTSNGSAATDTFRPSSRSNVAAPTAPWNLLRCGRPLQTESELDTPLSERRNPHEVVLTAPGGAQDTMQDRAELSESVSVGAPLLAVEGAHESVARACGKQQASGLLPLVNGENNRGSCTGSGGGGGGGVGYEYDDYDRLLSGEDTYSDYDDCDFTFIEDCDDAGEGEGGGGDDDSLAGLTPIAEETGRDGQNCGATVQKHLPVASPAAPDCENIGNTPEVSVYNSCSHSDRSEGIRATPLRLSTGEAEEVGADDLGMESSAVATAVDPEGAHSHTDIDGDGNAGSRAGRSLMCGLRGPPHAAQVPPQTKARLPLFKARVKASFVPLSVNGVEVGEELHTTPCAELLPLPAYLRDLSDKVEQLNLLLASRQQQQVQQTAGEASSSESAVAAELEVLYAAALHLHRTFGLYAQVHGRKLLADWEAEHIVQHQQIQQLPPQQHQQHQQHQHSGSARGAMRAAVGGGAAATAAAERMARPPSKAHPTSSFEIGHIVNVLAPSGDCDRVRVKLHFRAKHLLHYATLGKADVDLRDVPFLRSSWDRTHDDGDAAATVSEVSSETGAEAGDMWIPILATRAGQEEQVGALLVSMAQIPAI